MRGLVRRDAAVVAQRPDRPAPPLGLGARRSCRDVKTVRARARRHGQRRRARRASRTASATCCSSRGEAVDDRVVRTLVPVSVRTPGRARHLQQPRLGDVRRAAGRDRRPGRAARRRSARRWTAQGVEAGGRGRGADVAVGLRAADAARARRTRVATRVPQRNVNTVTTNVPGPAVPAVRGRAAACSRPSRTCRSAGTVRIGVAIFSYDGGAQLRRHRRLRHRARHRRPLRRDRTGHRELVTLAAQPSPAQPPPRRTRRGASRGRALSDAAGNTETVDVAIVGGGLSGLSAARRLRAGGRTVTVLEARERVGGKMRTDTVGGHHADLGAHWIGPTQDRIAALARELGVRTSSPSIWRDARCSCRAAGGARSAARIPPLSPLSHRGARHRPAAAQPAAPAGCRSSSRGSMPPSPTGMRRPSIRSRGATCAPRDARMFLNLATELVFGAEPEELSLLYFLFYLESGGGLTSLTEFEGGAQQDHFVGGSQQLCDRLAERLGGRCAPRHAGRGGRAGRRRRSRCAPRTVQAIRARHAIVAVSPALAGRWHWARPLPADRDPLAQRMPMGAYMKVRACLRPAPGGATRTCPASPTPTRARCRWWSTRAARDRGGRARLLHHRARGRALRPAGARRATGRGARVAHPHVRPARRRTGRRTPSATGPPSPTAAAGPWG